MVFNSYSSSSSKSKINIERDIVVKINKQEYLLIKLPIYPSNKDAIKSLMKKSKALIQAHSVEEGNCGMEDYITLLVPSKNINTFVGEMPFHI